MLHSYVVMGEEGIRGSQLVQRRLLPRFSHSDAEAVGDLPTLMAAAHELKTPLSTVRYLAALLQDDTLFTPEERRRHLLRIQLTAERSLHLVNDFTKSYSLLQNQIELEPVNVAHVCEDVLHELHPLASELSQTIEFRAPRQNPLALANHTLLRSVVTNLCDNALKHNPPESHVAITALQNDQQVRIAVRDNGPRIHLSDFRRLKQQLGQVQPFAGRAGSSGLGLFIAHQLSGAMNGRLGLTRHHDKGITLALYLEPSYQLSLVHGL